MKASLIKSLFLVLTLCSFTMAPSSLQAQHAQKANNPATPSVTWAVTGTTSKGGTVSKFVIRNTSDQTMLTEEWELWFNSMRLLDPATVTKPFRLVHVNGDLYKLEGFKGIAPGDSAVVSFAFHSNVINYTFAPAGLYISRKGDPDQSINIDDYTLLPYRGNIPREMEYLAAQYDLNHRLNQLSKPELRIIPRPTSMVAGSGSFLISANTSIRADKRFAREAAQLSSVLRELTGKDLESNDRNTSSEIRIEYLASLEKEAYTFESNGKGIIIRAADPAGAFYAVQTLKALLPAEAWEKAGTDLSIPAVSIQDQPRFAYRGFMMDIARNFQPKEQVMKVLDLMAHYKLNTFHLHFSDDEGWRIEIAGLPELTEIGSRRGADFSTGNSILPAYGSGAVAKENQYLTEEDFIEILRYAAERHIRVIPEIETPGHARAAIKAMDKRYERLMQEGKKQEAEAYLLRDFEDRSVYSSAQYFTDNVMNVALPSTYRFIETVLDAFVEMYDRAGVPLETVSLGGDEVPNGAWEKSPRIQDLMKNRSMKSVHEVWPYYIDRLTQLMAARKLKMAGWEEMGMINQGKGMKPNPDLPNKNIYLDVWNNVAGAGAEDLAYKLANLGYKVVFIPANNFYLDQAWNNSYLEPGHSWATFTDLERSFSFIPLNFFRNIKSTGRQLENLTAEGRKNIVGVKASLFAEKVIDEDFMEHMLLPRLLVVAERAWAPEASWEKPEVQNWEPAYKNDWHSFAYQVNRNELRKLDHLGSGFAYRIPDIGVKLENNSIVCNTASPHFEIRYTTDGSEPDRNSAAYRAPIPLKGTVKLKAFAPTGRGGKTLLIDTNSLK